MTPRLLGLSVLAALGGLSLAACMTGPGGAVGQNEQALTDGQVNALNNVGRATGITYALLPPPDADHPETLAMEFAPISDLDRTSSYVGGDLDVSVRSVPPIDPDMPASVAVDVYPPDPGAPALASLRTEYPPDPGMPSATCEMTAGGLSAVVDARLTVPPDPEHPPDPGRFALSVSNGGAAPFLALLTQPPEPEHPPDPGRFTLTGADYVIEGFVPPPDADRPGALSFRVIDVATGEVVFNSAPAMDIAPPH